jgi:sugar lactone lactonase YvrE
MRMTKFIGMLTVFLAVGMVLPSVFAQESELPDQVLIQHPGLFPEGIEWDAVGSRFLVGSLSEGTIYAVADDGTLTPFIEDDDLRSSVGIHIDAERNRLLVCNSDRSEEPQDPVISLMAYDLETGERLFAADLASVAPEGNHFANDVTVDGEGNAYVTDSFSPVIYKVDLEGTPSVFLEDEQFASTSFGLNGIDFHPNGYLIVGKGSDNALFKVPLDDPASFTQVTISGSFMGPDGLFLEAGGDLIAVGPPSAVYILSSEDDWQTATVVTQATTEQQATTVTVRNDEVYAVQAHLDGMGSDTPPDVFEIVHVMFAQG